MSCCVATTRIEANQQGNRSTSQLTREMMETLYRVWGGSSETRVHGATLPKLILARNGDYVTTGCVVHAISYQVAGSHFCPTSKTIVLEFEQLEYFRRTFGEGAVMYIVAHEYAHHMQNDMERELAPPNHELWADCDAGAALAAPNIRRWNSISDRNLQEALATARAVGGGPIHGTGTQRMNAVAHGMASDFVSCSAAFNIIPKDFLSPKGGHNHSVYNQNIGPQ